MSQRIIKSIISVIVVCLLGIIIWYGFNQPDINNAINECSSYIGKSLKATNNTYVKPPNILCLLSRGNIQLVPPGEVAYDLKDYDHSLVYFDLQNSLRVFLYKIQNKLIENPFNNIDIFDNFHTCLVITPVLPSNSYVFVDNPGLKTQFKDNYSEYTCFNELYSAMFTEKVSDKTALSTIGMLINNKELQNIKKDIYFQLYFFPGNIPIDATILKQNLALYNNINNIQYIIHNK